MNIHEFVSEKNQHFEVHKEERKYKLHGEHRMTGILLKKDRFGSSRNIATEICISTYRVGYMMILASSLQKYKINTRVCSPLAT
jgi:hypothetical protein